MTSPSTLTLGQVKASSVLNIIGVCPTSPQFVDLVNEAVSRLMTYGDWWATTAKARVCVSRNCVAWPRWVGTILAINWGGHNRPIQNGWYDFIPVSSNDCLCYGRWKSNLTIVDDGLTPVFNNVPCGSSNYIRAYTRLQADVGQTVHLFGIDENGQTVMSKDASDQWYEGEILTLATPYVQSAIKYREVTRVIKSETTGPIDLYQYDSSTDLLLDMAHYEPSETNPMYRHSTVRGGFYGSITGNCCTSSTGTTARKVEILAKVQHIPAIQDTDTIQIDNIPALKLMIQAVRLEEAGDDDGSMKKQTLAIKELNRQLRNKLPLDQIPIYWESNGTARPVLHGIGQIM